VNAVNTVLNGTPVAPAGWKVVYSTTPTSTTAEQATWSTTLPSGTVTRVGFINDVTLIPSVAPGTSVTGFSMQIKTTGATGAGPVNIYNIAQVVGTTVGNSTKVYDNSGDQVPDNFNSSTTTFPTTPDSGVPGTNGAVPLNQPDTQNNNSGTNGTTPSTGYVNVTTLSVPSALSLLNGPNGVPDAVGPTNNNDDFTNKSSLVPPGTIPGTLIDPAPVSFTNTVENIGTTAGNISLIPTPPLTASDLPTNTVVTVSYKSLSATYTYDGTKFVFTSGVGTVNGNPISASNPLQIPATDALASGASKASYGVSVDLPSGTPLSTDTTAQGISKTIQRGFPTPITAFIDTNNSGSPTAQTQNITIDRVYTGFLQLVKQSRVLQGTGPALPAGSTDGTFSITSKKPAPGNIIEYQITYTNISDPQAGNGDVILNASKVVITEDGTKSPNNWALDNDSNGQIDTSNIIGSAQDSGAATITFFNGNPAGNSGNDQTGTTFNSDVTEYVDTVTGTIAPGVSRTFKFQRKVN
jgi:hypothetical protein